MRTALQPIVASLPMSPGCYIFTSAEHSVLYVGKSKRVRSRVRQYFQNSSGMSPKIKKLTRLIAGIEFIPAETEIDALLLEYRLIKQYRPPFNSQMKRDGRPPYIRIDLASGRPGLQVVFEPLEDGSCFGHFSTIWDANNVLALLNDIWHTPLCGMPHFDNSTNRACLNRHLGKCLAPCDEHTDENAYRQIIIEVYQFLTGENTQKLIDLKQEMIKTSEAMAFEIAAKLRDQYRLLERLSKRLKKVNAVYKDKKLCVFIKGFHEDIFLLAYIESGAVCITTRFPSAKEWPDERLNAFIERIKRRDWDGEPDKQYNAAIAVIHAQKHFVDITHKTKTGAIRRVLLEAFPAFIGIKTIETTNQNLN